MVNIFDALKYSEERQVKREDEFIRLRQGTMSVAEYETQFTKLSKFVPQLVITEPKRKRRFIQGLNLEIQEALVAAPISTFGKVLERAQRIENAKFQLKAFQAWKRSIPNNNSEKSRENAPLPKAGRGVGGIRLAPLPLLPQRKFEGVPARGAQLGKGQYGGLSRGSQVTTPRSNQGSRISYTGRTNPTFVKGKLASSALISGIQARKLLYKGAQGYLAYLINTKKDKVKIEEVPVVKDYLDMFPEELTSVPPEREVEFKIKLLPGTIPISKTPYRMAPPKAYSALISGIQARKLLYKGAQGYLAYLINTKKDKVKIEEVPVVKDYLDMFPEELTSVPPEREVEFKIKLLPGTIPISKTPYRMAPPKLKELKIQLQDLLERGFIQLSESP
ncbi:uncharacterized protein [Coffea arabica]|uniref:Retrotransposon gag domain-containing protein n=1 Tax=Coffea arabica TaxID=13443 RepID=A0ABM4WPP3_COFAR